MYDKKNKSISHVDIIDIKNDGRLHPLLFQNS